MLRFLLIAVLTLDSSLAMAAKTTTKPPYTYVRAGNASNGTATGSGGIVLMGGSTDVDDAFKWMCAQSGGGDFLIIRATGTDAYNPYVASLCPGLNSVATLIIPSKTAANSKDIQAIIANAEAIWFAGGDQSNYINYYKGTLVQAAVNERIAASVPIGGTSAGLNVLTEFIYSAQASKGVTSSQALADPYNRYMSFDRDFVNLPILKDIIGDPHFATRDRMGRDIAFLCRLNQDYQVANPRGISVDEETALVIANDGVSQVIGKNNVYFLNAPGVPQECSAGTPLTYTGIGVNRLNAADGAFVLDDVWAGNGGARYVVDALNGVLNSDQDTGSPY